VRATAGFAALAVRWQYRRRRAQRKRRVGVGNLADLLKHNRLTGDMRPDSKRGHGPIGADPYEDMRLIGDLCGHDLRLASHGNSAQRAGSSSPSRSRRKAALLVRAPCSAQIAVAPCRRWRCGAAPAGAVASFMAVFIRTPSLCALRSSERLIDLKRR